MILHEFKHQKNPNGAFLVSSKLFLYPFPDKEHPLTGRGSYAHNPQICQTQLSLSVFIDIKHNNPNFRYCQEKFSPFLHTANISKEFMLSTVYTLNLGLKKILTNVLNNVSFRAS